VTTSPAPSPSPAALKAALASVYGDSDYSVPDGAEDAMERALRWPTYAKMADVFFGNAFHLAPGKTRRAMIFEMAAAQEAAIVATMAAQAARYADDPFARFEDQKAAGL